MKKRKKHISFSPRAATPLIKNNGPPKSPDGFMIEMMKLFRTGDFFLFEQKAREAARLWPNNPFGWKALGNLYLMQGKHEEALENFLQCVRLAPDDAQVINNLGSVFLELGRFNEAEANFRRALELRPEYAEACSNLATVLLELGNIEEAVANFRKALALKPDFALAHNNLGNAYKAQGDYLRAKESYLHALALNPNLPEANNNLGLILEQHYSDMKAAMECYQKALSINPDYVHALRSYGNFLVERGRNEGFTHLERANQLQPDLKYLQHQMGLAYLRYGKYKKAAKHFRAAIKQNPDDIRAKYFLNIAEEREPEPALRQKYVQAEFDAFPDFEETLIEKLKYNIPALLREFLEEHLGPDMHFDMVADLGCGTGLSGFEFRKYAGRLIGIDISETMLSLAAEKKCYDDLYLGDITNILDDLDCSFDLFIATDVFVYFGNLEMMFKSIRKKASSTAYLVFSTEHVSEKDFILQQTGRYAHSVDYIQNISKIFSCGIIDYKMVPGRKEREKMIMEDIYIIQFC